MPFKLLLQLHKPFMLSFMQDFSWLDKELPVSKKSKVGEHQTRDSSLHMKREGETKRRETKKDRTAKAAQVKSILLLFSEKPIKGLLCNYEPCL